MIGCDITYKMIGCDITYKVDYHHSVIVSQRDAAKFIRFAADFLKMSKFYKKTLSASKLLCQFHL